MTAYSLSEVEATARKAARGAGYHWGLADAAGQAVRMLCAAGLDGCAAAARLLESAAMPGPPEQVNGVWEPAAHRICPITAGASLVDLARTLPETGTSLLAVAEPLLILPACADIARLRSEPVTLSWQDGIICIGPEGLPDLASIEKLEQTHVAHLTLHPGGNDQPPAARVTRAAPKPEVWDTLLRFAARTYAPATEASRRTGAGAGQSDND